jgi:hypothetical protein
MRTRAKLRDYNMSSQTFRGSNTQGLEKHRKNIQQGKEPPLSILSALLAKNLPNHSPATNVKLERLQMTQTPQKNLFE